MDPNLPKSTVVIDNGSGYMKIGLSGQGQVPLKFPSIVGKAKNSAAIAGNANQPEGYVGKQIQESKRHHYKINYPIKHGVIEKWDEMELLWKYSFSELNKSPTECAVLLTEVNLNPIKHRKQIYETFFQKFQTPAAFVATQAVLSLIGTGKTTGLVVDSGDGVTHIIPVHDGFSLDQSCQRMDFAGRDVTQHLRNLLRKSGVNMETSSEFQTVKTMKENYCSIQSGEKEEQKKQRTEKYTLPDGKVIELCNNERQAGQILFSPHKIGLQHPSIVKLVLSCLSKVDIDLRRDLCQEMILSGGNTLMSGFPDRFIREVKKALPADVKARCFAPDSRGTMCWEGGNILSSLSSFQDQWITKADYMQKGDSCFLRRKI